MNVTHTDQLHSNATERLENVNVIKELVATNAINVTVDISVMHRTVTRVVSVSIIGT